MAATVYNASVDVLSGLIGRQLADITIRMSAMKMGKPAEELVAEDVDELVIGIRKAFEPLTTADKAEEAISEIRRMVR